MVKMNLLLLLILTDFRNHTIYITIDFTSTFSHIAVQYSVKIFDLYNI